MNDKLRDFEADGIQAVIVLGHRRHHGRKVVGACINLGNGVGIVQAMQRKESRCPLPAKSGLPYAAPPWYPTMRNCPASLGTQHSKTRYHFQRTVSPPGGGLRHFFFNPA